MAQILKGAPVVAAMNEANAAEGKGHRAHAGCGAGRRAGG